MRNLKKVLSVLLVVAMIAMTMVPAFAAESYTYDTQAKALNAIGLFNGVSDTEFDPDLGSALTREQGFALIIRILGKGADAKALTDADSILAAFEDADKIESSLKNEVALAVKLGLVKGDGKNVDAKGAMLGKDFATVLLRQLGYADTEFTYDTATATLAEKGGLTAAEATKFATKELIRDDLVGMAYGSLKATYKTGETVIDKLIADKVVSEDKAIAAGIKEKVTSATSMTAKGTGRDSITVTFNGTVDTTKVTLAVKRGTTPITTTTKFADDKKSATLVGASKFSEGDYTVTAAGLAEKEVTATVSYEDERVDKIEFTSDKAVIIPAEDEYENKSVYVYFKLENQYGEDITDAYTTYSGDMDWSTSYDSIDEKYGKYGKLIISYDPKDDDEFNYGTSVPVSVVYNDDEHVVTASTVLTVGTKAGVGSIEITKLYNDMGEDLDLNSTYSSYYLLFNMKDQYGNEMNINADEDLIRDDLTVSSSNNSIVEFSDNEDKEYDFQNLVVDGKDYIALPIEKPDSAQAGSTMVTVVSATTGKMAQYTIEVGKGTYAASFSLSKPDVAVIGEKIIIPFTAYDADGNEVTDVDDLDCADDDYAIDLDLSGAGVSSSEEDQYLYFEENPTTHKAQLVLNTNGLDLEEDDNVTITAITGQTYKSSSITLKMKDAKVPESITGISSTYLKKIAQGAFAEFKYDKLTVEDNYDRVISGGEIRYQLISDLNVLTGNDSKGNDQNGLTGYTAGQYRIAISSSSSNVKVVGGYGVTDSVYYMGYNPADSKFYEKVYFYGAAEGTATITAQMQVDTTYGQTNTDGTDKASVWADVTDCDYKFTMTTVDRDDIKSIKVGSVASTYDYNWYTEDSNNYALKSGRDFTNQVAVTGVLSDGSEVALSQQIVPEAGKGMVDAYTVSTGYSNKITVAAGDAVVGNVYNAAYKAKFKINTSAKLNDDEDETVTVPFTVTPKAQCFENVSSVTSSFTVSSADPQIQSAVLVYNQFAQIGADGSVEINSADLVTLRNWATANVDTAGKTPAQIAAEINAKVISKIVADSVKCLDQYGKEHDAEILAANSAIYTIQADGVILDPTNAKPAENKTEVTVITNNGAKSITFTISVK